VLAIKLPLLNIRMNLVPKVSCDFQQFAPFRVKGKQTVENQICELFSQTPTNSGIFFDCNGWQWLSDRPMT
jgi:hypothetical protein